MRGNALRHEMIPDAECVATPSATKYVIAGLDPAIHHAFEIIG
jgi:hypothetical protein